MPAWASSSCSNLRVLKLNGTKVADAGITAIGGLQHLERLNLYGTEVGDPAIDVLEVMPALTHVYLWNTKGDTARRGYASRGSTGDGG